MLLWVVMSDGEGKQLADGWRLSERRRRRENVAGWSTWLLLDTPVLPSMLGRENPGLEEHLVGDRQLGSVSARIWDIAQEVLDLRALGFPFACPFQMQPVGICLSADV